MTNFLPGIRFSPTEEELLSFYLFNKLNKLRADMSSVITDMINVFSHEPCLLPGELCVKDKEQWFFFCPKQTKEGTIVSGFWKTTSSPSVTIYSSTKRPLGIRKTMFFYDNHEIPTGQKTKWKLSEYRLFEEPAIADAIVFGETPNIRNEFSLCRLQFNCLPLSDEEPASTNELRSPEGKSIGLWKKLTYIN